MNPFRQRIPARFPAAERNGHPEPQAGSSLASARPESRPGLVAPRLGPRRLLWEVLVELGFVDEQRVLEAESVARAAHQDLGAVLLERGLVSPEQLARAVADREGLAFVDLDVFEVDERAASMITPAVAERYGAVLIGYGVTGDLLLAVSNPREKHAINDIAMMVDPPVTPVVATRDDIEALIRRRQEATYRDQDDEGAGYEVAATEPSSPTGEEGLTAPESESLAEGAADVAAVPEVMPVLPEAPASIEEQRLDVELLESLAHGMGELERLLRESAGDSDRERAAALARAERESGELRAQLEAERAERAQSERALREELETERATREALATDLAAVRTARDDLARRVASARDLLELAVRPQVPLGGREH